MSTIVPKGDQVLLRLEPEQDHFSQAPSLFRPDAVKQDHVFCLARVLAVGPGKYTKKGVCVPVALNEGQRVMFVKFLATHTKTGQSLQQVIGDDCALVKEADVLCEVDDDFDVQTLSQ